MKIFILSDESWYGGASIANHRIMEELGKRGHIVEVKTINDKENDWNNDLTADLYIVANWAYIPKEELINLFDTKPVIKFFHDIPGYMYQPRSVYLKDHYDLMQLMIDKAKLNIFISPLQLQEYRRFVKVKEEKAIVMPPPKDMSSFKNENKQRKTNSALYLGDISEARGISKTIQLAKQNEWTIDFVGPFVDQALVDQLKADGYKVDPEIPNDKVAELMNQYENFIYLPNLIDSFCLKVVEAELCGCSIIADRYRLGRYYYDSTAEKLKELIEKSHIYIANEIERLMKDGKQGTDSKENTE